MNELVFSAKFCPRTRTSVIEVAYKGGVLTTNPVPGKYSEAMARAFARQFPERLHGSPGDRALVLRRLVPKATAQTTVDLTVANPGPVS